MYVNTEGFQPVHRPVEVSITLSSMPSAEWVLKIAHIIQRETGGKITGNGRYKTIEGVNFKFSDGLESFKQNLQESWNNVREASFSVCSKDKAICLQAYCNFNNAETAFSIAGQNETVISQLLETLEHQLGLEKLRKEKISIRRIYFLPSIPDAEWVAKVTNVIATETKLGVTGSGNYKTIEGVQFSFQSSLQDFEQSLQKNWGDVRQVFFKISNKAVVLQVSCQFQTAETSFEVNADTQEATLKTLEVLENCLGLQQFDDELMGGQKRHYTIQQKLEPAWFEQVFEILLQPKSKDYFSGSVVVAKINREGASYSEITHRSRNLEDFKKQIDAHFKEAHRINCWVSGRRSQIDFSIDLQRRSMMLGIDGWKDEIQQLFQQTETALSLKQQIGDLYQNNRLSQTYDILEWISNTEFSLALEQIIQDYFTEPYSRLPAVVEATFTGGTELKDSNSYKGQINEFISRLASDQRKLNAALFVQGPDNKALRIFVDRDSEELKLQTASFSSIEFSEIGNILGNKIKLEPKSKTSTEKTSTEKTSSKDEKNFELFKSFLETYAWPIAVVFTSVFLAGPVILPFLGLTKYELTSDSQIIYSNPVLSDELVIEWKLIKPRLFGNTLAKDHSAKVKIVDSKKNTPIYNELVKIEEKDKRKSGKVTVTGLEPGNYHIYIETVKPLHNINFPATLTEDEPNRGEEQNPEES